MIALLLLGCGGVESQALWMEGAGFRWAFFNHRVSFVELGVDDTEAYATVVGGTSTTNVFTELDAQCDTDTCREFPFIDMADITLSWARTTTKKASFGSASAEVVADADGETLSLTIPLDAKGKGTPTVILRGYRFDTIEPLEGEPACYQPKNGWIPKSLGIALDTPILADDRQSVTVNVTASFEAGVTNEEARVCLDAVVDRARVRVQADVLAIVTKGDAESFEVSHGMAYEFDGDSSDPPEQPPPDLAERTLGTTVENPLVGWSRFEFIFHEVGEERGAYLRSFEFLVDPLADVASGHSTNYSPMTQLSAFDYTFSGTAQAVDVGAEVERGAIEEQIPVILDAEGVPQGVRWEL